ncbi:MAG: OadG family protein [Synergistaceae bacterium]|jgi:sodium pump decarboxylase gamma subunit|nr:OadG family protein [Synergistaceae bacterium]
MNSPIGVALVYSFIAFSIVFIVLGVLTAVIYAMRLLTGEEAPKEPPSSAAPAAKAAPAAVPAPAAAASGNTQHVAAITAAILSLTQGRGRVLSVTPVPVRRPGFAGTSSTWRAAGVVESVNRGIAPSWKR